MPTHLGDALAQALLDGTAQTDDLCAVVQTAESSAAFAAHWLREARRAARDHLSAMRIAAGHSQDSLADASGIGRRAIVEAEAGRPVDLATLTAIVAGLGKAPGDVILKRLPKGLPDEELQAIAENPETPRPLARRARNQLRQRAARRLARVRDNP
jgi:DNA-binding XRE family transcriptional regulator